MGEIKIQSINGKNVVQSGNQSFEVEDANGNGVFDNGDQYISGDKQLFTNLSTPEVNTPAQQTTTIPTFNTNIAGSLFDSQFMQQINEATPYFKEDFANAMISGQPENIYSSSANCIGYAISNLTKYLASLYADGPSYSYTIKPVTIHDENGNVISTGETNTETGNPINDTEKRKAQLTAEYKEYKEYKAQQAKIDKYTKVKQAQVSKMTQNLYNAMKGPGTKNELLDKTLKGINKDNVLEIMDCWNKNYKSDMDNENLLQSINNDTYIGETGRVNHIINALVARGKEEGLTVEANAFKAKVTVEQNNKITSDDKIEAYYAEFGKKLRAKVQDDGHTHLTRDELKKIGINKKGSTKQLSDSQKNASEACQNFYIAKSKNDVKALTSVTAGINKNNVKDFFSIYESNYKNDMTGATTPIYELKNISENDYTTPKEALNNLKNAVTNRLRAKGLNEEADSFEAKVTQNIYSIWQLDYDKLNKEFANALSLC